MESDLEVFFGKCRFYFLIDSDSVINLLLLWPHFGPTYQCWPAWYAFAWPNINFPYLDATCACEYSWASLVRSLCFLVKWFGLPCYASDVDPLASVWLGQVSEWIGLLLSDLLKARGLLDWVGLCISCMLVNGWPDVLLEYWECIWIDGGTWLSVWMGLGNWIRLQRSNS